MKYCDVCQSTYPSSFTTCPKDQAPLRLFAELAPGMVIRDKYEILDKIGTGGMATVYKAKHVTFNEICAIKVVSSKLLEDQDFLRRFKNEAIITRKLHHPNAVALNDFDVTADGRPFIIMEYVQGRSLRSIIHDLGALPGARAFNIAKQVAAALGAAHKLGIVHRDIKPDNIIVMAPQHGSRPANDVVKVFDFGIAKMRGGHGLDISLGASTQTGMVVGTPQYVSPEQASGKIGDQIDGRSDIYSLGIVLYEMLTGKLPFKSDSAVGYLVAHMQTPPTPPQALKPPVNLPESVWAVLSKCLEKDRNNRYQNAEELIAALDRQHTFAAATVASPAPNVQASGAHQVAGRSQHSGAVAVAPRREASVSVAARPAVQRAAEGRVYGETAQPARSRVFVEGIAAHLPALPWKKIGTVVAMVVLLFVAVGLFNRYRNANNAQQVSTADQDATIKEEIEEQFRDSDSLRGEKITVAVQNGIVTLSGTVKKPYLSEIANTLAKNVDGVQSVDNEIQTEEERQQKEQVWGSNPNTRAFGQRNPYVDQEVQQYIRRGYQLMQMRDFAGAQNAFQSALDLAPNNQIALTGLHRAQLAQAGAGLLHR